MSKKSKKKEKPYYSSSVNNQKEKKDGKDLQKNRTFIIGVGFLIIIFSRYNAAPIHSLLFRLLGLGVMLYGIASYIYTVKKGGKPQEIKVDGVIKEPKLTIDFIMSGIILVFFLYNLFILFKIF